MKCRFYSTQERLSIGDYEWEWRLAQKERALARSEPVGRPVPCGCGEISSRIRNLLSATTGRRKDTFLTVLLASDGPSEAVSYPAQDRLSQDGQAGKK